MIHQFRSGLNTLTELGIGELVKYAPEYLTELVRHKMDKFDLRYGTDTNQSVSVSQLDVNDQSKAAAELYWPVRESAFSNIVANLDVLPSQMTFVDLGSGKGRALLLASEHGFSRAIGVEFSPSLCRTSEANASAFRKTRPDTPAIEVVCTDARTYAFPRQPLFLFLFDPFGETVLTEVIDALLRDLQSHPRMIRVAYYLPMHRNVLESRGFECLAERRRSWRMSYPWVLFKGPHG